MDAAEVYTFLDELLADLFGRRIALRPALAAKDVVGWDSFRQVEITLALEEKFDIRIRVRELNEVADIAGLVALVLRKEAAK